MDQANRSPSAVRCGIILAAGEGKRLRPLVHRLRGDQLPKQYVDFIGSGSLLEQAYGRAERLIDPRRIFTVVGREHLKYPEVRRQLAARPRETVIVQPENKETGPGLLLPLAHVFKNYPDSTVAIFPSDHFIVEEGLFAAHVDLACRVVERHPGYLILLGMEPREPETEYGYILPGGALPRLSPLGVRPVLRFREKPDIDAAREILGAGGLWNTMVMAGRAKTLIDLVRLASPRLHRFFNRVVKAIGTGHEGRAVAEIYRRTEPVNFSTGLLEILALKQASRLLVLPVRGVTWSDWGSERRLIGMIGKYGYLNRPHGIGKSMPEKNDVIAVRQIEGVRDERTGQRNLQ